MREAVNANACYRIERSRWLCVMPILWQLEVWIVSPWPDSSSIGLTKLQAVADAIRTVSSVKGRIISAHEAHIRTQSLGPRGMDKMVRTQPTLYVVCGTDSDVDTNWQRRDHHSKAYFKPESFSNSRAYKPNECQTNDGNTMLKGMSVMHPAAKMLVDLSAAQDVEAGDGTTSVVVIAGSLLGGADRLLAKGTVISPQHLSMPRD